MPARRRPVASACLEVLHTLVNDLLQLDALAPEYLCLLQRRLHHGLGDPEHRVAAAGPRQARHLAQVEGEALQIWLTAPR